MKYTAVLWGYEDDLNSIDPLEASNGDINYWVKRVGYEPPGYVDILKNNTGLYMTIYEGDVPADAPWNGRYEPVEEAYVGRDWSDATDTKIAAALVHVSPQDVILKRG